MSQANKHAQQYQPSSIHHTIRLQVYLAKSGICSRRAAIPIIEQGKVTVNKKTIILPGWPVDPQKDEVRLEGQIITIHSRFVYYMMNKPRLVESTNVQHIHNPEHTTPKRTVRSIVNTYYHDHIFSVGRLDYHSSGLLLFTTDGDLSNKLCHPRYGVEKTYRLETNRPLSETLLMRWKSGLRINNQCYTLKRYTVFEKNHVELVLCEGKNREIREVCAHAHVFVKRLHRITYGTVSLGNLGTGKMRTLTDKEIRSLYNQTNSITV